jgi:hypothetical protein
MPDRVNVYSHVEVIQNTPAAVVVYWRYLSSFTGGNPHGNVRLSKFVDETFNITPDGKVNRVIKQATGKTDEWKDPLNQTEQHLQLNVDGLVEASRIAPRNSTSFEQVMGNPENKNCVVTPILWFKFDEGTGAETKEGMTQDILPIAGPKALWKKGVSGTALEFDGYHSVVVLPVAKTPAIASGSLTLEGWVALGAYPWNWAPIVQQGDNKGYFLGVDSHGYPGFMLEVDGKWQQLTVSNAPPYADSNHLALFRWYQLAGTYDKQDGMMRLFINGQELASKFAGTGGVQTANADVRVGKAGILRIPTNGTHDTHPCEFGMDGLIDEVRVYNQALSVSQVSDSFAAFNPGSKVVAAPDMQKRHLPAFDTGGKFTADYTHLTYHETWDNLWCAGKYSDVLVGFDQLPVNIFFRRGTSYIPEMVNEAGQWDNNEFSETGFTRDAQGDCEPMSDKPCLDSHVRVIENNGARIVIHWRYRLANPVHRWAYYDTNGWGDIADWYYYIYPDGLISKQMRCYSSRPDAWHEWDEQIVVFGEGQHPESVIKKVPVMTLVDSSGKAVDYDWNPNPPKPEFKGRIIQMIHLTGKYSPFTIQNFDQGDIYKGERTWYSVFPTWNHWPISQIDSSGRNALFPDRVACSSISHLFWPCSAQQTNNISFQEKILLEGMTDQPAAALTNLARSWLDAPQITNPSGGASQGYDQSQRAYCFEYADVPLNFTIAATADHPIHNLCFVVRHWKSRTALADLKINQVAQVPGAGFRQGVNIDTDGIYALIVWIDLSANSAQDFQIAEK